MNIIEKYKLNDPPCNFKMQKSNLVVSSLAGMVYEYTMSANAVRYYIHADLEKLPSEGAGKQLQNLGSFSKLRDFYGGQALVNLLDIPFAILFLGLIYYLAGILVIVPIILISIFVTIIWYMGNKLKVALEEQDEVDDDRYNFIIEALQGIHTIKSYGIESIFARRYERLEEKSSVTSYRSSLISSTGYNYGILFNEIMIITIVAIGAPMVIDRVFTTGALIATVLLSGRLMQPIQKAVFLWVQYQDYSIAEEKAIGMLEMSQIKREKGANPKNLGNIEVSNLSYQHEGEVLFKDVNLEINIPDVVAIHSSENFSKSIFLKLIAGITIPSSGSVKINSISAEKYQSENIVHHIGVLSSENIIFQGTILENLTAFEEKNEKAAMEIVKILDMDKEIALLPEGYDTQISDGIADIIPPGIKQKIAIVRVLLHKPKIILFDNADKGLDKAGYNQLIRLLNLLKGKVAMIIVTDDHNITRIATREFILENKTLKPIQINDSRLYDIKPYRTLRL